MSIFRPYSSRLSRGTLLLIHSPAVRLRYARVRRGIVVDTMGLGIAALLITLAGWLAGFTLAVFIGATLLAAAGILAAVRSTIIRRRERHTPAMLFVSDEGISAIMPDHTAMLMTWKEVRAHEARFRPGLLIPYDSVYQREEARGLLLEGDGSKCLYITRDLDGFADLLEVLAELDIPLSSVDRMQGLRTHKDDALERRIW